MAKKKAKAVSQPPVAEKDGDRPPKQTRMSQSAKDSEKASIGESSCDITEVTENKTDGKTNTMQGHKRTAKKKAKLVSQPPGTEEDGNPTPKQTRMSQSAKGSEKASIGESSKDVTEVTRNETDGKTEAMQDHRRTAKKEAKLVSQPPDTKGDGDPPPKQTRMSRSAKDLGKASMGESSKDVTEVSGNETDGKADAVQGHRRMAKEKAKLVSQPPGTEGERNPPSKQIRTSQSTKDMEKASLGESTKMSRKKGKPSPKETTMQKAPEKAEKRRTEEKEHEIITIDLGAKTPSPPSKPTKDFTGASPEDSNSKDKSSQEPAEKLTEEAGGCSDKDGEYEVITIDPRTRKLRPLSQSAKDFTKALLEMSCREISESMGDEMDAECEALLTEACQSILHKLDKMREPEDSLDIADLEQKLMSGERTLKVVQEKVDQLSKIEASARIELERLALVEPRCSDVKASSLEEAKCSKSHRLESPPCLLSPP